MGSNPAGLTIHARLPLRRKHMSAVIVEIRAAEGGDDAKLLVNEQFRIYEKYATRRGL